MTNLVLDVSNSQVLTISGASAAQVSVFTTQQTVLLTSNTAVWVAQAVSPTAVADTAGNTYIPANFPVLMRVPSGEKLAAIQDSAAGQLCITPVSNVL